MAHEIWGDRFAAVRIPAWHGIGKLYEKPVIPSVAALDVDLLYDVDKYPLMLETPNGLLDSGLVMVGRVDGEELISYGTAKNFDVVMLADVLPNLDDLAKKFPLSAAGALKSGATAFFTFGVSDSIEIAGEEYKEYLTVLHSYTPGVAHKFIYSPVRVVCQNTLIMSESAATNRIAVSHAKGSKNRLDAGYIVSDAIAQAQAIRKNLETLTALPLSEEVATNIVTEVYSRYAPAKALDPFVSDLVADETMAKLYTKRDSQERYVNNLTTMAMKSYATLNDEYPKHAGTAYNLFQAIVEVADWRKGKSTVAAMESAVIGTRAAEKKSAWEILSSMAE